MQGTWYVLMSAPDICVHVHWVPPKSKTELLKTHVCSSIETDMLLMITPAPAGLKQWRSI